MTAESILTAEMRWHGRPLRHYTDAEIQAALQDRQDAITRITNKTSRDFCQIAIDRLQGELEGRMARKSWVAG